LAEKERKHKKEEKYTLKEYIFICFKINITEFQN